MNTELWSKVLLVAVCGFFGAVVVTMLVWWIQDRFFSAMARARRALRRAPKVPIDQVKDGQVVKVAGELRCETEPLRAPLSRRPCAYYHTIVEQETSLHGTRHNTWETIIDQSDCCRQIVIDDGTGIALVDLVDPVVVLERDQHFGPSFLDRVSEEARAFLAHHDLDVRKSYKTLKFNEQVLEVGKQVAVFGFCQMEPDPDPHAAGDGAGGGYRDLQTPMRLRIVKPQGKLLVSDEPGSL